MRFVSIGFLLLSLVACESTGRRSCPVKPTEISVRLTGDLQLRGALALETSKEGLRVKLRSTETPDKGPEVVLDGVGQCENGIVRARFVGGAATGRKDMTVLGAELEGVFEPKLDERPFFGAWSVDLVDGAQRRRAKGFLWHDPGDA
jgi:hypothetical protein